MHESTPTEPHTHTPVQPQKPGLLSATFGVLLLVFGLLLLLLSFELGGPFASSTTDLHGLAEVAASISRPIATASFWVGVTSLVLGWLLAVPRTSARTKGGPVERSRIPNR